MTLRRTTTGKWFAYFSVETDVTLPPQKGGPVIGTDVGLESFATRSNGEVIENPRFFRSDEKELARFQGKLSEAPKGTSQRKKSLNIIERIPARIANRRSDFISKASRELVDRFGIVASEDLNIRYMLKNHGLAKHISDVAGICW